MVRSTNIDIENVDVTGNARSGLLFDLGTLDFMAAGLKFVGVNIIGAQGGFGALCQRHQNGQFIVLANGINGWDAGILRDIPTLTADQGVQGPMEIGGVIGPEIIPAPFTVIKGGLPGTTGP